uniref:Uncharacterized protein n=1 Tax=Lactuca sativa TaxID=4236 RepID=A0A9R1UDM7_LACSA|nr:hypothetical protein LSAT_V11C900483800 [Lactuca sativa]
MLNACVILHNMIIEEESMAICSYTGNDILNPPAVIQVGSPTYFSRVLEIQNREIHHNLCHDLTEHIWGRQIKGEMTMKTKRMKVIIAMRMQTVTTRQMKAMRMVTTTSSICLWFLRFYCNVLFAMFYVYFSNLGFKFLCF